MAAPAATVTGISLYSMTQDVYAKEAVDLAKVRASIVDIYEKDAEKRDDGTSLAGTFIRLAWHACGTYDAKDGKLFVFEIDYYRIRGA
jgi:cytochrome c peroxidase